MLPVDGCEVRCHLAEPRDHGPAVVVLHAWWGLTKDVTDVCDRLSREGFWALAPDLFQGRTASTVEEAERLASQARTAEVVAATRASVAWCRQELALEPARLALLGFSFGAAFALDAASHGLGDAVVAFYGTTVLDEGTRISVPVLGHYAENDPFEPRESVAAFFRGLAREGTDATLVEHQGTGHWFFEPSQSAYDPAAAEKAWSSTLAFLRRHLVG